MPEVGRNDPCPCGSGKKYKKCCLAKDETVALLGEVIPAEGEHRVIYNGHLDLAQ